MKNTGFRGNRLAAIGVALAAVALPLFAMADGDEVWDFTGSTTVEMGGAYWKSSASGKTAAPTAGNVYRIPSRTEARIISSNCEFPDAQLLLEGTFSFKGEKTLTAPHLVASSSSAVIGIAGDVTGTLKGDCTVADGATLTLNTWNTDDSRNLIVSATLEGTGALAVLGSSKDTVSHLVCFSGPMDGFTGDIRVAKYTGSATKTKPVQAEFANEAFPGDPDEVRAAGFAVADGATLKFMAPGAFGENRGFDFGSIAPTIYVELGKTVTIAGPLVGKVGFIKTGGGTLTLTGNAAGLSGCVSVQGGLLRYVGFPNAVVSVGQDGAAKVIVDKAIILRATGYEKRSGEERHVAVEVSGVEEGVTCDFQWSLDGLNWTADEPQIDVAGVYSVYCQASAPGYTNGRAVAQVLVDFEETEGAVYLAPPGASNPQPPYATPATAADDFADAVEAAGIGGLVLAASGRYVPMALAQVVLTNVTVRGPENRQALVAGNGLKLGAGATLSGFSFVGLDGALDIATGAEASNCFVRGSTAPVQLMGGTLANSEVCDFTGTSGVAANENGGTIVGTSIHHGEVSVGAVRKMGRCGTLRLFDCQVCSNTCPSSGAVGTFVSSAENPVVLVRCRVIGNAGKMPIGRFGDDAPYYPFCATNCLFAENVSTTSDALVRGVGELVNCTIVGNRGRYVFCCDEDGFKMLNTVIADNENPKGDFDVFQTEGEEFVGKYEVREYSLFPGATGTGNLDSAARFEGEGSVEPYRLRSDSPGVNAGAPLAWRRADRDLAGGGRVRGGRVDMGCFESASGMSIVIR